MSDLISRHAVLAIVKDSYLDLGKFEDSRVFCAQIKELPSVPERETREWIPVSERLPKAFETVLRTRVENGWNGTTYTIVDIGCICPADHNIVAWMPLPDYYKGEVEHE